MPQITVGLRDGFQQDEVHIYVNEREVYSRLGVTSKLVTSFADQWKGEIPDAGARIRVELPKRHLSETTPVDRETRYVMVSVFTDRLQVAALTEDVPQM
jgi:hypothetical protein